MALRKFLGKSFSFTLASISGYINKTKGKRETKKSQRRQLREGRSRKDNGLCCVFYFYDFFFFFYLFYFFIKHLPPLELEGHFVDDCWRN